MKKITIMLAACATTLGAQSASAATFGPVGSGTHVFSGTVVVQKDIPSYTCTATVYITVNSATDVDVSLQGNALSGAFPCALIAVTGSGDVTWDGSNWGITGLTIDPPISSGICNGRIRFLWDGGTPRKIHLQLLLSDSLPTTGSPCTMQGTLMPLFPSNLTMTP